MRRLLRRLPPVLLLALLLPGSSRADGPEFVRVFAGWRDAASFRHLAEYFDGREHTGGVAMLRTQPGERGGYYWLVRLKNGGPPVRGATFELQVITPAAPEVKTFTFPAEIPTGRPVYDVGLTGADWPGPKARPVAWRLRLLGAGGRVLLARQSFLWALPEK